MKGPGKGGLVVRRNWRCCFWCHFWLWHRLGSSGSGLRWRGAWRGVHGICPGKRWEEAGVAWRELGWGAWVRALKVEWPSRAVPTFGESVRTWHSRCKVLWDRVTDGSLQLTHPLKAAWTVCLWHSQQLHGGCCVPAHSIRCREQMIYQVKDIWR